MRVLALPVLVLLPMALAPVAGAGPADCRLLLDALDKADRQPRVAQYDVETRDQPLQGTPFLVRIGKVVWVESQRSETDGTNPVLAALRRNVAAGSAKCEPAGSDTYRGTAVVKVRFDNPVAPKQYNPTTMWIDAKTGLPVYHELAGLGPGGFAWIYGDAVKEPAGQ